ncbi:hypothetical protein [Streptomyces sp. NPDC127112]|uniref:hypothetical protein n=1 Tax=Streptomyces sp. NPDC127112 TaxID=3345364 RepID=UPI00363B0D40
MARYTCALRRYTEPFSDHADLPHTWYQASVRYNWRNGEELIPTTWLDTNPTP